MGSEIPVLFKNASFNISRDLSYIASRFDIDENGHIDLGDIKRFIFYWDEDRGQRIDFDQNGKVDLRDFKLLVEAL